MAGHGRPTDDPSGCVGPFPFASGFLVVLSAPLAAQLVREQGAVARDIERLRGLNPHAEEWILEDQWLGSGIYRDHPRDPVTYVSLTGARGLVVSDWGLKTSPQALLTHVVMKRPERFLALHDFHSARTRCAADPGLFRLECPKGGCISFGAASGSSSVCNGTQADARMCAIAATPRPRKQVQSTRDEAPRDGSCCHGAACTETVDLYPRDAAAHVALGLRWQRVVAENLELTKLCALAFPGGSLGSQQSGRCGKAINSTAAGGIEHGSAVDNVTQADDRM